MNHPTRDATTVVTWSPHTPAGKTGGRITHFHARQFGRGDYQSLCGYDTGDWEHREEDGRPEDHAVGCKRCQKAMRRMLLERNRAEGTARRQVPMKTYRVEGSRWVREDFRCTVRATSRSAAIYLAHKAARSINANEVERVEEFAADVDTTTTPKMGTPTEAYEEDDL